MPHTVAALLLAVACATLYGCGQMGPLYLPPAETASGEAPEQVEQAEQAEQADPDQPQVITY